MQDVLIAIICFCGAATAFGLGLMMWKRRRAARAWAEEKATIAECAHADRVMAAQLQLLRSIHQRWPETIRIALDSHQHFTPEVNALLHGAPLQWEMLENLYRERPESVHVTLNSRLHRLQICDAQRLGVRVAVDYEAARARPNPREGEVAAGLDVEAEQAIVD